MQGEDAEVTVGWATTPLILERWADLAYRKEALTGHFAEAFAGAKAGTKTDPRAGNFDSNTLPYMPTTLAQKNSE